MSYSSFDLFHKALSLGGTNPSFYFASFYFA